MGLQEDYVSGWRTLLKYVWSDFDGRTGFSVMKIVCGLEELELTKHLGGLDM